MKKSLAVASALMAAGSLSLTALPASAAGENYLKLSWDNATFTTVTTDPFFPTATISPGDSDGRYLTLRNVGPSEATMKVYIVDVKTSSSPDDPFFQDTSAVWRGSVGTGSASFTDLAKNPSGATLVSEVKVPQGQETTFGFGYKYDEAAQAIASSPRSASYRVQVELVGETPPPPTSTVDSEQSKVSLKIIPKLQDANGNGVADLGETITWTFTVENTGANPLSSISIASAYLEAKGVKPVCASDTLAPGATTTCTVTTKVAQEDLKAGQILLTAHAIGEDADAYQAFSSLNAFVLDVATTPKTPSPQDPTTTPSPGPGPQGPGGTASPSPQVPVGPNPGSLGPVQPNQPIVMPISSPPQTSTPPAGNGSSQVVSTKSEVTTSSQVPSNWNSSPGGSVESGEVSSAPSPVMLVGGTALMTFAACFLGLFLRRGLRRGNES